MIKSIMLGIGIMFLGFIITAIGSDIFNGRNPEFSYYSAIISVLYLSAIVGIFASLILKELRENKKNKLILK